MRRSVSLLKLIDEGRDARDLNAECHDREIACPECTTEMVRVSSVECRLQFAMLRREWNAEMRCVWIMLTCRKLCMFARDARVLMMHICLRQTKRRVFQLCTATSQPPSSPRPNIAPPHTLHAPLTHPQCLRKHPFTRLILF